MVTVNSLCLVDGCFSFRVVSRWLLSIPRTTLPEHSIQTPGGNPLPSKVCGPTKVRCGPATVHQPRLPSHGLHCLLSSLCVRLPAIVPFAQSAAPCPPWLGHGTGPSRFRALAPGHSALRSELELWRVCGSVCREPGVIRGTEERRRTVQCVGGCRMKEKHEGRADAYATSYSCAECLYSLPPSPCPNRCKVEDNQGIQGCGA